MPNNPNRPDSDVPKYRPRRRSRSLPVINRKLITSTEHRLVSPRNIPVQEFAKRVGYTDLSTTVSLDDYHSPDSELLTSLGDSLVQKSNPEQLTLEMALSVMKQFGIDAGGALMVREVEGEKQLELLDIIRLSFKNHRLSCTRLSEKKGDGIKKVMNPEKDLYFSDLDLSSGVNICPTENKGVDAYINLENENGEVVAVIFLDKTDEALDLSAYLPELDHLRKEWGSMLQETIVNHEITANSLEDLVNYFVDFLYSLYLQPVQSTRDTQVLFSEIYAKITEIVIEYYASKTGERLDEDAPEISQMRGGILKDLRASESIFRIATAYTPEAAKAIIKDQLNLLTKNWLDRVIDEKKMKDLSLFDDLTGLPSRISFYEELISEISRAVRRDLGLHVLLVDIDSFRRINKEQGSSVGDEILRQVALTIKRALKDSDCKLARYDSKEFIALFPNTDTFEASLIASRIRENLRNNTAITELIGRGLTLNFGLAHLIPETDETNPREFINRADKSLYQATENGENLIVIDGHAIDVNEYIGTIDYEPLKYT